MLPCLLHTNTVNSFRRRRRKRLPRRLASVATTSVGVRKMLTASVRGSAASVITIVTALAAEVVAVVAEALHSHTALAALAHALRRPSVVALTISGAPLVRTRMCPPAAADVESTRLAPQSRAAALDHVQRHHRAVAAAQLSAARRPVLSRLPVAATAVVAAETSPAHAALLEDRGGREAPPVVKIEPDLPRRLRDLAHARLDAAAAETVRHRLHLPVAHRRLARAGTGTTRAPGAATLLRHRHRAHTALLAAPIITSTRDLPPPLTTTKTSALMFARTVIAVTAAAGAVTVGAKAPRARAQSVAAPMTGTSRRRGVGTRRPRRGALLQRRTAGRLQLRMLRCTMPRVVWRRRPRLVNKICGLQELRPPFNPSHMGGGLDKFD